MSFHIGFHHGSHDTCSASYHLSSDSWYLYGLISSGYYHGGYQACDDRVHGAFGHNCAGFECGECHVYLRNPIFKWVQFGTFSQGAPLVSTLFCLLSAGGHKVWNSYGIPVRTCKLRAASCVLRPASLALVPCT